MDKKLKKLLFWIFGIVFVITTITLVVLSAYDKISLGKAIAIIVGVVVFMLIVFFIMMWIKKSKDVQTNTEEKKQNEAISDDEALRILREELKKPHFADYILIKDAWTSHFGQHHKYPIFTAFGISKIRPNNYICCSINKITKEKAITYYPKMTLSRQQIELDIINKSNLLSSEPINYQYKTTRRITAQGDELEVVEPIEKNAEEKEQEKGEIA